MSFASMCEKFIQEKVFIKIAEGIQENKFAEAENMDAILKLMNDMVNIKTEYKVVKKTVARAKKIPVPDYTRGEDRWFEKSKYDEEDWGTKCTFVSPLKVGKNIIKHGNRICGLEGKTEEEDGWRCQHCINQKTGKSKKGIFHKWNEKKVEAVKQEWYECDEFVSKCNSSKVGLCAFASNAGKNKHKVCGAVVAESKGKGYNTELRCTKCIVKGNPKKGVIEKLLKELEESESESECDSDSDSDDE